jgi:alpha-glucosidase
MTWAQRDWPRSVIYQLYVRSFRDSDGDGIGDLPGVIESLPYLRGLDVDAVWLSPIHPSPDADLGYDVTDYVSVDPRFGSLADFDALLAHAHAAGIAVILDWVVNHTSDRHPWFREARASTTSPRRDWYLFRPGRGRGRPPNNWRSMFGGSAWDYDEGSGEWYLHTFLPAQPDLNWRNEQVREAIRGRPSDSSAASAPTSKPYPRAPGPTGCSAIMTSRASRHGSATSSRARRP